jgi:hypothetical protein
VISRSTSKCLGYDPFEFLEALSWDGRSLIPKRERVTHSESREISDPARMSKIRASSDLNHASQMYLRSQKHTLFPMTSFLHDGHGIIIILIDLESFCR